MHGKTQKKFYVKWNGVLNKEPFFFLTVFIIFFRSVNKIKYMNQDNVYKNKVNIVNTVGKTWFVICYKINSLW